MDTNIGSRAAQAEQRVAEAKDSLWARLEALGERLGEVRQQLDLEGRIIAHPLAAVGIAFALGAGLGAIRRRRSQPEIEKPGLSHAIAAGAGALAMRLGKEYALRRLAHAAKDYMERHGAVSRRERTASRDRSVEPFLEH